MSDAILECWYERSQQLLTLLLHSFAKTKFFELIKHVEVDVSAIGVTGGELAFKLLDSQCYSVSEADKEKLLFVITNFKMQGLSFSRYCELGLNCQATLKRCPTAVDYNFFVKQWVDGICPEWESQKAQMRYELSIRIDADALSFDNYNLLKVIARFTSIITDARVYLSLIHI